MSLTYSIKETALVLGISETSVRRAIERGEIPTIRIGARRLVARKWVDDKLAGAA